MPILLLLLFVLLGCSPAPDDEDPVTTSAILDRVANPHTDGWLIIGDSNSLTHGVVSEMPDPTMADAYSAVKLAVRRYPSPGSSTPTDTAWGDTRSLDGTSFGLEVPFARAMGSGIAVVKFGVPGADASNLNDRLADIIAYCQARQTDFPGTLVWRGVITSQGENDFIGGSDPSLWSAQWLEVIDALRATSGLGRQKLAWLVLQTAQTGSGGGGGRATVRTQQAAAVAATKHARLLATTSATLPQGADGQHYGTSSILTAGGGNGWLATQAASPP